MATYRIAFLHPDLGLGGAERLVVDAAAELAAAGHHVDVYTAYYDPQRCFQETKSGAFSVHVHGSWFPRSILGRMIALCAYIRCLLCALVIVWRSWNYRSSDIRAGKQPLYDVVIADQVSAVVPVLRYLTSSKVLFYCHFPDLLLAHGRSESVLKRLYRAPLDALEEHTTGEADLILVNSNFTRKVFQQTFKTLAKAKVEPEVLYPTVLVPSESEIAHAEAAWAGELDKDLAAFIQGGPMLLSINRFERKKGIALAIEALAAMQGASSTASSSSTTTAAGRGSSGTGSRRGGGSGEVASSARLVIAGGYDERLAENRCV
jgi:alpha-1,3/alpha-1,6-mannosyltransferase